MPMFRVTIAAIAIASAVGAQAQPNPAESIDREKMLPSLSSETVMPVLAVTTGNDIVSIDGEGREYISATATNGLKFELQFRACSSEPDGGCKGMNLVAFWQLDSNADESQLLGSINEFSRTSAVVNAGLLAGNKPYVSRYVIADHGISQGNLLSEISNFIAGATRFAAHMDQGE